MPFYLCLCLPPQAGLCGNENYACSRLELHQSVLSHLCAITGAGRCLPPTCLLGQSPTLHSLWTLHLQRWPILTDQVGGPTSWNTCRMWWWNPCGNTRLPGPSTSLLMQLPLNYQWVTSYLMWDFWWMGDLLFAIRGEIKNAIKKWKSNKQVPPNISRLKE